MELNESVYLRLNSFGYIVEDSDKWLIAYIIDKVETSIENECNLSVIPDGLRYVVIERTCGEFLQSKKQSGLLQVDGLNFDDAISSIKEGDTQVSFNGESSDDKFNHLISWLLESGKSELLCYRRIKW